jgi:hypothetical protein
MHLNRKRQGRQKPFYYQEEEKKGIKVEELFQTLEVYSSNLPRPII